MFMRIEAIDVKAGMMEGLGSIGEGSALAAMVIVLLKAASP